MQNSDHHVQEEQIGNLLHREGSEEVEGREVVMYVTMEPCGKRLSGNIPCARLIAQTRTDRRRGIDKIYFGVKEPQTFVEESEGCKILSQAGVEWELVEGMEAEILKVASSGHEPVKKSTKGGTNVDDIPEEERRRQEKLPRNPKKRMMEAEVERC
jgi:pyrimidine deaminase RibD-like protein